MITLLNFAGYFLMGLVAYNYINFDLGFTPATSIALVAFGMCLAALYRGYELDKGAVIGWSCIIFGSVLLAVQSSLFTFALLEWLLAIAIGYRIAGLPFDTNWTGGGDSGNGHGHDTSGDGGGCD